jgi:hypothetical protein
VNGRHRTAALGSLVLAMAFSAPAAQAQTVAGRAYDESGGVIGSMDGRASAPAVRATTGGGDGSLPFSGLDVGLLALMGAGLVGTGAVIRRGVRTPG